MKICGIKCIQKGEKCHMARNKYGISKSVESAIDVNIGSECTEIYKSETRMSIVNRR